MNLNRFCVCLSNLGIGILGGFIWLVSNNAIAQSSNPAPTFPPSLADIQHANATLMQEIDDLDSYHRHLMALSKIDTAEEVISASKKEVTEIDRQAMLYRMILDLETFIISDLPIQKSDRLQKIQALKTMMTQSIYSDVEKYQRILAVWRSEMQIGHRFFSYSAFLNDHKGEKVAVTLLHLGRMSLLARQVDGSRLWKWDVKQGNWHLVSPEEQQLYQDAFDMQKQKRIKDWVTLPITMANIEGIQ